MADNTTNATPMKVVTGEGLAYYHEKVKLIAKDAKGVEITQAEYDALETKENKLYYILES